MTNNCPKTLLEAARYFSDRTVCHEYMKSIKWPDGNIVCPKCGNDSCHELASRPGVLKCNRRECQKQFSYKVGTIFEDSPLGLDKWFVAVWAIANCRNGISSHELGRAIGVTQKTAWFMLHRIRKAMETGSFRKLEGEVEADETFVGGRAANMHKHKRAAKVSGRGPGEHMTAVQGLRERGGEIRIFVVTKTDGETLQRNVRRHVDQRASVFTDAAPAYDGLSRTFLHQSIDHALAYVRGRVHTNGLENFWSLLKRSIKGTYTHVAPFHLERYCAEHTFRYGVRRENDGNRFLSLLKGVLGKRLTFRELCAIDDAGFMGIQ